MKMKKLLISAVASVMTLSSVSAITASAKTRQMSYRLNNNQYVYYWIYNFNKADIRPGGGLTYYQFKAYASKCNVSGYYTDSNATTKIEMSVPRRGSSYNSYSAGAQGTSPTVYITKNTTELPVHGQAWASFYFKNGNYGDEGYDSLTVLF